MHQPNNDQASLNQRLLIFMAIFLGVMMVQRMFFSPQQPAEAPAPPAAEAEDDQAADASDAAAPDGDPGEEDGRPDTAAPAEAEADPQAAAEADDESETREAVQPAWVTLGSVDPESPYRMLVTLSNRGAALMRVELSSNSYRDTEDRTGYFGQIVADESIRGAGCLVQIVGSGTPAEKAGLQPGDIITQFDGVRITGFHSLRETLLETRPGQSVEIVYLRDGQERTTKATLATQPLALIRPETLINNYDDFVDRRGLHGYDPKADDPLSMLLSLQSYDGKELPEVDAIVTGEVSSKLAQERDRSVDRELPFLELRRDHWEVVAASEREAVFRYRMVKQGLEILKTYRLARDGSESDPYGGYHLDFEIEIRNIGQEDHEIAYVLDGPNGLPTEGAWYARKVGPGWSSYGLRDVVVQYAGRPVQLVSCSNIAVRDDSVDVWRDQPLNFLGVDAQYFSAVLIPQKSNAGEMWLSSATPIRVGGFNPDWKTVTNTSVRLTSEPVTLEPGGDSLKHTYRLFAGPKKTRVLEQYDLGGTIFYGWFWFVAIPLQHVLHALVAVVQNYGLAIILLTVIVRLLMHPISRKQLMNVQKQAELQPELKKIGEKHKNDPQARMKAQQELFRKHNFNPLSGCGVMFLQLPIFIGLYRALQVDVELREASLISPLVRWCSNLAAPDMLFDWSGMWQSIGWDWFNTGQGMFALGPYFNLLPMLTVVLFQAQQMLTMPKPQDEQARMNQKIMQFMMLFMGLIFFKVASGLCLYFIASSIWGLVEKRFLPKPVAKPVSAPAVEEVKAKAPPKVNPKKKPKGGRKR